MSSLNSVPAVAQHAENCRVKLYVIDPAKYKKQNIITKPTEAERAAEQPAQPEEPAQKCKPKKRKIQKQDLEETNEFPEAALPVKEVVTKTGRVSKPYTVPEPGNVIPKQRIRRREPPSMFKCKTCLKVYVGHTKLKNHFLKYPNHESNRVPAPARIVTKKSVGIQVEAAEILEAESEEPIKIADLCLPSDTDSTEEPPIISPIPVKPVLLSGPEFLTPNSTWNIFSSFQTNSNATLVPDEGVDRKSDDITPPLPQENSASIPSSPTKTVWDCVDEKINNAGINQALVELVDVADKLGKISRDKIIPIREEEEELGIHNSLPIVRVDSPYLSHLLDLPFGTYVYREDGGIRRPPLPPPSATELSLTSGEVDIEKFLATNAIQTSLPHLTNIDFADM